MKRFASNKMQKANILPSYFVLVFLGNVLTFFLAPTALAEVKMQNQTAENFPTSLVVPIKSAKSYLTIILQKISALAPQAFKNQNEPRLKIPSIKVNAAIKEMGLTPEGAMAVPSNNVDVGWFSSGTRPGETGSAVIGGHNRWNYKTAVFDHLDQLKKGDALSVVNAKGVTTTFVVKQMRTYDSTDVNTGIFASESGAHLNLITCSGTWNPITKNYPKRLVIYTDVERTNITLAFATPNPLPN